MAEFIIGDLTDTLDTTTTKPKLLITGGNGLVGNAFRDIAHQYEEKYKNFKLFGPTPIMSVRYRCFRALNLTLSFTWLRVLVDSIKI